MRHPSKLACAAVLSLGLTSGCNVPAFAPLPFDPQLDLSSILSAALRCGNLEGLMPLAILGQVAGQTTGQAEGQPVEAIGIIVFALFSIVTVALGRMRMRTEQRRLEVAQRLVEKGFEPPMALLVGPARRDLRKGIVLLCAGLGLLLAGLVVGERHASAAGLVPLFIGVGYLVSYRLAAREEGASS